MSLASGLVNRDPRVCTEQCSHHVAGQQGKRKLFEKLSMWSKKCKRRICSVLKTEQFLDQGIL